jgi:hypothetical protein
MDTKHDYSEEWKESSVIHKGKAEEIGKFLFQQMSH